jgi:hypothetical protein
MRVETEVEVEAAREASVRAGSGMDDERDWFGRARLRRRRFISFIS